LLAVTMEVDEAGGNMKGN